MFNKYVVLETAFRNTLKPKIVVRFVSAASAAAICALRMSNTQLVFANGTVFCASKERKDALFMEYKYARDDVK